MKETAITPLTHTSMLDNDEYYKYIFKKTEKIACAVFYILRNDRTGSTTDAVIDDLENAAKDLLERALESLGASPTDIDAAVRELQFGLVSLESHLRVAHAARHLSIQFLEVFLREISSLQRALRTYKEPSVRNPFVGDDVAPLARERKVAPRIPRETRVVPSHASPSQATFPQQSRRERIMDILKDKGSATIKDITDVITDCSEKTIQRELIGLINDNKVHREGERRWSKYMLV